jgi:hypothetical protein
MMSSMERVAASPIFKRVEAFIREPRASGFEELALEVFAYQFAAVPLYRALCESVAATPRQVNSFAGIPFASTVAFKHAFIANSCEADAPRALSFKTSGTTKGYDSRGIHRVPWPEIYRLSAVKHLRRMLFPDNRRIPLLALHPGADRMPESSLSWMVSWCLEEFGEPSSLRAASPKELDCEAAIRFLRLAETRNDPIGLLGTTAAFARLFEALRGQQLKLPNRSRMMDTGGPKGQTVPLKDHEVRKLALSLLGIEPDLVINEYGMTELCSQLYDLTAFNSARSAQMPRLKLPPAWMRPVAIDPMTLRHLPDGRIGLMAFFDLANVGSISAIMTEDFGYTANGTVGILGRAAAGDPRGCALAIEQFANVSADASSGVRRGK